jgi:hypothetical protein
MIENNQRTLRYLTGEGFYATVLTGEGFYATVLSSEKHSLGGQRTLLYRQMK